MNEFPEFDEKYQIIRNETNEWIYKLQDLTKHLMDNIVSFPIDEKIIKQMELSTQIGGIALRNIKTLLAPAIINAEHKTIRKIWNDMNTEIIYITNNKIK
jgi:hypothetical protein